VAVARAQRFTRGHPCPVCGGWDALPRGRGARCSGFASDDGLFAHCSREELAGGLAEEASGTYAHRLAGPCKCGVDHGGAPAPPAVVTSPARSEIASTSGGPMERSHIR
jgi:hypothetical protein